MTTTARLLAGPAHAPTWNGRTLTWLDRRADRLRTGRLVDGAIRPVAAYGLDATPLSALPTRTGWLVATRAGVVDLRRDGRTTPTRWPAADLLARDPGGRLWLATPHGLLAADLTGHLRVITTDTTLALTWHPDATTAYRSTPTGVHAHPFDLANGTLGTPTPLTTTPATSLTTDTAGHLWTTTADGVHRLDTPHRPLPAPRATGCCFTADHLVVTTATGLLTHDVGAGGRPSCHPDQG